MALHISYKIRSFFIGIAVLLQAIYWGSNFDDIHLYRAAIFFLHYSYFITTNCLLFNTFERLLVLRFPKVHVKVFKTFGR